MYFDKYYTPVLFYYIIFYIENNMVDKLHSVQSLYSPMYVLCSFSSINLAFLLSDSWTLYACTITCDVTVYYPIFFAKLSHPTQNFYRVILLKRIFHYDKEM